MTSKKSPTKSSPTKNDTFKVSKTSPVSPKNIVSPKLSQTKSTSLSPVASPSKMVQTTLLPQKIKSPSPLKKKLDKEINCIKVESPKKKLDFIDDSKTTIKKSSKRKISPVKTPDNKKYKVDSIQSPDTQVSNIIYLFI